MRTCIACVALALSGVTIARGEVVVEIVNMPSEVYSFEPVYVLFAVENTGSTPVYLPAEGAPHHGPGVYSAAAGKQPAPWPGMPTADVGGKGAHTTMWLAPRERWLFYRDIGRMIGVLEGEVAVQAVMSSSDGLCSDRVRYGRHRFALDHIGPDLDAGGHSFGELYRCWQGEARSAIWTLTVRRSLDPIDRAARDYLVKEHSIIHDPSTGTWSLQWAADLRTTYAASHYAYAVNASWAAGPGSRQWAVAAQPQNPLNPWVMGQIATDWLDRKSSCWLVDPMNRSPGRPDDFALSLDDLELPSGVRDYLEQHRWYLEHRHCPAVLAENKKQQRRSRQ